MVRFNRGFKIFMIASKSFVRKNSFLNFLLNLFYMKECMKRVL